MLVIIIVVEFLKNKQKKTSKLTKNDLHNIFKTMAKVMKMNKKKPIMMKKQQKIIKKVKNDEYLTQDWKKMEAEKILQK